MNNKRFIINKYSVLDITTNLEWMKDISNIKQMKWGDAKQYFADIDGRWRLPIIQELFSIIDFTQHNPALYYDNAFSGVQTNFYWSNTSLAGSGSYAWGIRLGSGNVDNNPKINKGYIWPVKNIY